MYPGYSVWLGSLPINEIWFAVRGLCDKPPLYETILRQIKLTMIVKYCQHCFSFDMPNDLRKKQVKTFDRQI